ncbi:uncharacterized protein LOC131009845 [Salvia miltiorrhiza]|uniref:uncharacterized protein LOC131009845 n=1 Tax=Salvia miltiorrhiza TaxID=226208 RepID=UPI0025AC7C49|nr:uncharacterized protein LOC131009845 [Salvia miltiorrhiza]
MATGEMVKCTEQECIDFVYKAMPSSLEFDDDGNMLEPGREGSGQQLADAFDYLELFGLLRESDYRFLGQRRLVDWSERPVGMPRIYIMDYLWIEDHRDDTIRQMLEMKGPLVARITSFPDFYYWSDEDEVFIGPEYEYEYFEDYSMHVVLIVGYGEQDETPYYIIKNSYRTDSGHKGYAKIHRRLIHNYEALYGPSDTYMIDPQ